MSLFWPGLFLLGCFHGINPGMGWLFAVALGLQEHRTRAVLWATLPIALGHVCSVAVIVFVSLYAVLAFPHAIVHGVAGCTLLAFGAYRLIRARHPRWVGMHVGFWGLSLWSFLMASAHGAGLMLVPFLTSSHTFAPYSMQMTMPSHAAQAPLLTGSLMIGVHTLGYLLTMALVGLVVYRKFGVSFLRTAWFNVDAVWAVALLMTGLIALLT
jgi:hypothetical protein